MTRSWRRIVWQGAAFAFLTGVITVASSASAADGADAKPAKPKPSTSSLDDELFKDLNDGAPAPSKKPTPPKDDAAPKKPAEVEKPPALSGTTSPPKKTAPVKTPPKLTDPLDRELLDDLGGGSDNKPAQKPNDDAHGGSGGKPSGGDGAGGGEGEKAESDDPLVRLSKRVRDAEERLRRTDSGDQTQELQRGIVEDLEKLIAQIEQQKSQQKSSKSKGPPSGAKPGPKKPGPPKPGDTPGDKPSSNPTDSSDKLTAKKAERPDTGKLKEMLEKVWGNLPERERQDVMQSSFEDFPAKYQFGIEQYFKTLLQRQD